MKWLVLLLIASAGLLAGCEDASWVVAVNNGDGEIFFRTSQADSANVDTIAVGGPVLPNQTGGGGQP